MLGINISVTFVSALTVDSSVRKLPLFSHVQYSECLLLKILQELKTKQTVRREEYYDRTSYLILETVAKC